MSSKAVPESMHSSRCCDTGFLLILFKCSINRIRQQISFFTGAGKQIVLGTFWFVNLPVATQGVQSPLRKDGVTIFVAFCLTYEESHILAVYVIDCQFTDFRNPQSGTVNIYEDCQITRTVNCAKKRSTSSLLQTEGRLFIPRNLAVLR